MQQKLQGIQVARAVAALSIAYFHSWHITMPFLALVGFANIRNAPRMLVALGDASYSIYLIHPLVFTLIYMFLQPPLPPNWVQEPLRFSAIAAVCLLSLASWKMFETPFIALSKAVGAWKLNRRVS